MRYFPIFSCAVRLWWSITINRLLNESVCSLFISFGILFDSIHWFCHSFTHIHLFNHTLTFIHNPTLSIRWYIKIYIIRAHTPSRENMFGLYSQYHVRYCFVPNFYTFSFILLTFLDLWSLLYFGWVDG